MEIYNKMYQNETSTTPIETNSIWQPIEDNEDEIPEVFVTGLEIVETEVEPELDTPLYGRVVNCKKLNVREEPESDANVVCTIDALTDVEIDEATSTDEFYKVYLSSGLEGFCMKKFIVIVQD